MHEERALGELARILVRVNEQERNRDQAKTLLQTEMNDFERRYRDEFQIDLYVVYDRYLERLTEESKQASRKLEEMRPDLEREKEKVMEARRQRRIVELLKEKKKADYDREMRKWERKEIEEVNRHQRTRGFWAGLKDESGPERAKHTERDRESADDVLEEAESRSERERDPVADYLERMGLGKQSH